MTSAKRRAAASVAVAGGDVTTRSPARTSTHLRDEIERGSRIVSAAKISAD